MKLFRSGKFEGNSTELENTNQSKGIALESDNLILLVDQVIELSNSLKVELPNYNVEEVEEFRFALDSYNADISKRKQEINRRVDETKKKLAEYEKAYSRLNEEYLSVHDNTKRFEEIEEEQEKALSYINLFKSRLDTLNSNNIVGNKDLYEKVAIAYKKIREKHSDFLESCTKECHNVNDLLDKLTKSLSEYKYQLLRSSQYSAISSYRSKMLEVYESCNGKLDVEINGAGTIEESKMRFVDNLILSDIRE